MEKKGAPSCGGRADVEENAMKQKGRAGGMGARISKERERRLGAGVPFSCDPAK